MLPAVPAISGARIRELTGDTSIPETTQIMLRVFKAVAGHRTFHVGFCLGNGESFSPIGIAVIERLAIEVPRAALHVAPIIHDDIAWDMVLRNLRCFSGQVLLCAFPNSDVYDAGTAEISCSQHIRQFDSDGAELRRLTAAERRLIREQKAAILIRPPPPKFYASSGVEKSDVPWIFRIGTPAGKMVRTAVWDGRRNYLHEFPDDILRWVGGNKIAIVQVDSPVGINRRSSLDLTHKLAKDFDGIIHWARDTATFQSILQSFVRLDLESVSMPVLTEDWEPEVTILAANPDHE